jgi:NAD-dependent deacetylase
MAEQAIAEAARLLASAGSVAVLTGAGVSAESGVATFRGSGGIWTRVRIEDVATPSAFQRDPARVWQFYNDRRDQLPDVEPNPAHYALAELESLAPPRFCLITQNVDRLHQRAGSIRVLELHGNLPEVRCTACGRRVDMAGVRLPPLPRCAECGELLRPNVVWFGEALDDQTWAEAEASVRESDVLLVVGTSAEVYPAAGLVSIARRAGASAIEMNLERTGASANLGIYGPAGQTLPELVARVRQLKGPTGTSS